MNSMAWIWKRCAMGKSDCDLSVSKGVDGGRNPALTLETDLGTVANVERYKPWMRAGQKRMCCTRFSSVFTQVEAPTR